MCLRLCLLQQKKQSLPSQNDEAVEPIPSFWQIAAFPKDTHGDELDHHFDRKVNIDGIITDLRSSEKRFA